MTAKNSLDPELFLTLRPPSEPVTPTAYLTPRTLVKTKA